MIQTIEGGVCAAKGFTANGVYCGIRKNPGKKDLALIRSAVPANAAAVYTTNLVKGAPLTVTKQHLSDGKAQAVICNSGNANTCNADGIEIAEKMCALVSASLGIAPSDVLVTSTGVIGQPLKIDPIAAGIPALAAGLSENGSAEEVSGTDISSWVSYDEELGTAFSLEDAAAYRTAGAAKAIPGFDVMDYGQEDYEFGSSEKDARHWNRRLLNVFEQNAEELAALFNSAG